MYRHLPPRRGLTLIELLVVIFIVGVLFAMGVLFYPDYSAKQRMVSATDRITGMLLMAKQRAKRDGLVTGVRISTSGTTTELSYIQQPDTPSLGRVIAVGSGSITISANLTPAGGVPMLSVGDYLELNGGGMLYGVVGIAPGAQTTVTVTPATATPQSYPSGPDQNLSNYRIYAQPRLLSGEQVVTLPEGLVVNAGLSVPNLPQFDILFSPAGNVVGQTNTQGQVFVVVEDTDTGSPLGSKVQPKFIVAVRLRTGLIGVYPFNDAGPDYYTFAKDGRSSGL